MLSLSKKADYALVAMLHLAEQPGQRFSARSLARQSALPVALLMNLLKLLAAEGVIQSERGVKGGYTLALDPAQISLAQIVHAVEGPVALTVCMDPASPDPCSRQCKCRLHRPLRRVHDALRGLLETFTLADMLAEADLPHTLEQRLVPLQT